MYTDLTVLPKQKLASSARGTGIGGKLKCSICQDPWYFKAGVLKEIEIRANYELCKFDPCPLEEWKYFRPADLTEA